MTELVPRPRWREMLFDASLEVFSMMVGGKVRLAQQAALAKSSVTGTVGIAGALQGSLTFRCSRLAAVQIASHMLGMPPEQAEPQACDAVGEICNMIAGHFKAKVGLGAQCMLSLPIVVEGSDYKMQCTKDAERLNTPLLYEGELLDVCLDVHP